MEENKKYVVLEVIATGNRFVVDNSDRKDHISRLTAYYKVIEYTDSQSRASELIDCHVPTPASNADPIKKTKEYRIEESLNIAKMTAQVENLLKQGWECQGGISAAAHYNGTIYLYQALTRINSKQTDGN